MMHKVVCVCVKTVRIRNSCLSNSAQCAEEVFQNTRTYLPNLIKQEVCLNFRSFFLVVTGFCCYFSLNFYSELTVYLLLAVEMRTDARRVERCRRFVMWAINLVYI